MVGPCLGVEVDSPVQATCCCGCCEREELLKGVACLVHIRPVLEQTAPLVYAHTSPVLEYTEAGSAGLAVLVAATVEQARDRRISEK